MTVTSAKILHDFESIILKSSLGVSTWAAYNSLVTEGKPSKTEQQLPRVRGSPTF